MEREKSQKRSANGLTFLAIWMSEPIWHRSQISGLFSNRTSLIFCSIIAWLSSMPFNWFREISSSWKIIWKKKNSLKWKNMRRNSSEEKKWFGTEYFFSKSSFANKFINCEFYGWRGRLTSRPSTGCSICIETFTKWLPDKFNAFNCPNGTNNS